MDNKKEENIYLDGYVDGARNQAKIMYNYEEVLDILFSMSVDNPKDITKWFEKFNKINNIIEQFKNK